MIVEPVFLGVRNVMLLVDCAYHKSLKHELNKMYCNVIVCVCVCLQVQREPAGGVAQRQRSDGVRGEGDAGASDPGRSAAAGQEEDGRGRRGHLLHVLGPHHGSGTLSYNTAFRETRQDVSVRLNAKKCVCNCLCFVSFRL